MADNVRLNENTTNGALIATDEVGGAQYQYVKMVFGVDGQAILVSADNPLPVLASIDTTGLATESKQDVGNDFLQTISEEDFATSALQTSGNTSLSNIDTKTPALGQALAAASSPVVLPASQITALTPPAAISGFNLEATQLLIKAKTDNIPAQGQALAAASLPVVLPVAQITALTAAPTTVANNKVTVTTAGTRVALAASTTIKSVTVKASVSNAGIVYVGNATVAASNGFELAAGDSVSLDISDLATVFVDASINSQIVTFIAVN